MVDVNAIFNSILANYLVALIGLLVLSAKWLFRFFTRRYVAGIATKLAFSQIILFALFISLIERDAVIAFTGFFVLIIAVEAYLLRGLVSLGILDAYKSTVDGVDFSSSLSLSRSSISFLGIGAHKLTQDSEFENAMNRCAQSGRVARFLLSPPDSVLLKKLAKRNQVDATKYQENVRESLQSLARYKAKGYNIEVKHYQVQDQRDYQQFRLFIIDEKVCLLSWTVWGDQLGRNNPQLVLRRYDGDSANQTLAQSLMDYFERLWNDPSSTYVNLEDYK